MEHNSNHKSIRLVFRILGPALIIVGIYLFATTIMKMDEAFNHHHGPFGNYQDQSNQMFSNFGRASLGFFLIFIGAILSKFGYLGATVRYISREVSPVAKDTFNYMAEGTKDGVRNIAQAIKMGISDTGENLACPACRQAVKQSDSFCYQCGYRLK